jgi:hypothetical protein
MACAGWHGKSWKSGGSANQWAGRVQCEESFSSSDEVAIGLQQPSMATADSWCQHPYEVN